MRKEQRLAQGWRHQRRRDADARIRSLPREQKAGETDRESCRDIGDVMAPDRHGRHHDDTVEEVIAETPMKRTGASAQAVSTASTQWKEGKVTTPSILARSKCVAALAQGEEIGEEGFSAEAEACEELAVDAVAWDGRDAWRQGEEQERTDERDRKERQINGKAAHYAICEARTEIVIGIWGSEVRYASVNRYSRPGSRSTASTSARQSMPIIARKR